jgi:hypothetical protein
MGTTTGTGNGRTRQPKAEQIHSPHQFNSINPDAARSASPPRKPRWKQVFSPLGFLPGAGASNPKSVDPDSQFGTEAPSPRFHLDFALPVTITLQSIGYLQDNLRSLTTCDGRSLPARSKRQTNQGEAFCFQSQPRIDAVSTAQLQCLQDFACNYLKNHRFRRQEKIPALCCSLDFRQNKQRDYSGEFPPQKMGI